MQSIPVHDTLEPVNPINHFHYHQKPDQRKYQSMTDEIAVPVNPFLNLIKNLTLRADRKPKVQMQPP